MKRWVVRGKFNIDAIEGHGWHQENLCYEDGQYLYYHRTSFEDKEQATLFKTEGSAKGKLTVVLKSKEKGRYFYLDFIEVVEIQIVIPGE